MTHKYDNEIRAWLDGKTVQYKTANGWFDLSPASGQHQLPMFSINEEHRIKPEVVKYRLYLWKSYTSQYHVAAVHTRTTAETVERDSPIFARWLGDWQEAEV